VALSFGAPLKTREPGERVETLLFWGLMLLIAWAPIPLGSNRAWAWTLLEVWAFALTAAWLLSWAWFRIEMPEAVQRAWPAWIVLALWLALQAIYILPLPPGWVAVLSPEAAHVQAFAAEAGIQRDTMTLSVEPHASRVSLMKSLAYCAVFFLVLALASRRSRVLTLARVIVYAAVAQAIYAILMHLGNVDQQFFGNWIHHGSSASGTYANRNHFAGLMEMSLAVGIGLLIAGLSDRSADSWKKFVRNTIEWILSPKMFLRLSLCILVIALTTTHSRMGNSAFFSALLVAGALGIALSRYATRNTVILLVSLVAIDLFIVGSWFGVEKLAKRIGETTVEDVREREDPASYSIDLIKDYALFGAGPGTFYVAFPRYRQEKVVAFFDVAHNDYAQLASECGAIGFALMGIFVVMTLAAALVAQWRRRDPLMRGMSFACIMGTTAILIHSWVDFNLQIPANAVLFMVLLALGWISLFLDRREGPGAPGTRTANNHS
jgi:putative inorganic carbon (HCO3(-)) transporter